jgi:SEC-C motif domain protein
MRSRYSAFVMGDGAYLLATREGEALPGERAEIERWARSVHWLRLEVKEAAPSAGADEGWVTFVAWYLDGPCLVSLAERSRFVRAEGRWRYAEGAPQLTRVKVSRNDKCPCGSGLKFKHCHDQSR